MSALSMTIDHKRVFIEYSVFLPILMLIMTASAIVTNYVIDETFGSSGFYFVSSFMSYNGFMTMTLLVFNFYLYCLYLRFDLINSCIKEHFATQEKHIKNIQEKTSRQSFSNLLMKLADFHDSLVDSTVKLNNCFSLQMMNITAGFFIMNITSTFAIYRVFVKDDVQNFNNAVIQYAWNIYLMFFVIYLIALSSLMTRTGKYTAVLIHKAINFIDDDDDPIIDYVSFINQSVKGSNLLVNYLNS